MENGQRVGMKEEQKKVWRDGGRKKERDEREREEGMSERGRDERQKKRRRIISLERSP